MVQLPWSYSDIYTMVKFLMGIQFIEWLSVVVEKLYSAVSCRSIDVDMKHWYGRCKNMHTLYSNCFIYFFHSKKKPSKERKMSQMIDH